jgi:WD40 repeat protein
MKTPSLLLFFILPLGLWAQAPATEVYLFDLERTQLTKPVNISATPGYDNQPHFTPDGKALLFVGTVEGQTEVFRYELETGSKTRLTQSPASEYSPTVMPDGSYFSTIVLEQDGRQLLWKYPLAGGEPQVVVPDLVIGYHAWFEDDLLYSFVLGDTVTLQESDLTAATNRVLARNVGRSLHKIPGKGLISFIDKRQPGKWLIVSYNPNSGRIEPIALALPGVEDMAWSPDGALWMGKGSYLYRLHPSRDKGWQRMADLSRWGLKGISRLAVSPDGKKLALVVEE